MRIANPLKGLAGMERHHKVGAILAGVCMFAMAMGLTPGSTIGQFVGAIVVVLAFSSVIAVALGSREEPAADGVAGRITPQADGQASGRRAA